MSNQLRPLVIIIVVLAALLYFGGILWAGIASLVNTSPHSPQIPDIITNVVTAIGALLATYFGAVLGISVPTRTGNISAGATRSGPGFIIYRPDTWSWDVSNGVIQIVACYAYFFSLILAALFWLIAFLKGAVPADVLRNMGSALVGVVVGVVSVELNIQKSGPSKIYPDPPATSIIE